MLLTYKYTAENSHTNTEYMCEIHGLIFWVLLSADTQSFRRFKGNDALLQYTTVIPYTFMKCSMFPKISFE